jgi:sugar phosphate isomerase/epimerase
MATAAGVAAVCASELDAKASATAPVPPLGLQLYTVRDLMARDVAGTLALVARVGYREVEFAGYFGTTPGELRHMLDDTGLTAPAAHIPYSGFVGALDSVIEEAVSVGHTFIILPGIPAAVRETLDDYRRLAERFNHWGQSCARAGLTFGYHNHTYEFLPIDGTVPYDLLLTETEAAIVVMELDLAWAHGAHIDPVEYFDAWPDRFPLIHIKDIDEYGSETDIGAGTVPFDSILLHAAEAGLRHGFVERDRPQDSRSAIRTNYQAIRRLWTATMG